MKVIVTGSAGFIGSHVSEKLLQNKMFEVIGIDNINNYYNSTIKYENLKRLHQYDKFHFYKADILDNNALEKIFQQHNATAVIHLAARAGVRPSIMDAKLYEEVNVRGTLNLLELSKKYKISKFVFASSSSVYGKETKVPFTENAILNTPVSPYAATKSAGELFCYTYAHLYKIPTICLRFFSVYGPYGRPDMAPYIFTRSIINGIEIQKFGDGTSSRDYTYIDDIVGGVIAALEYKTYFDIFNLGNNKPVSLNELIKTLEKIIGKKAIIKEVGIQPGEVECTYANIDKAKQLLKYNPRTSLEEGLTKFVEFYFEHQMKNKKKFKEKHFFSFSLK